MIRHVLFFRHGGFSLHREVDLVKKNVLAILVAFVVILSNPGCQSLGEQGSSLSPTSPVLSGLNAGESGSNVQVREPGPAEADAMRAEIAAKFSGVTMTPGTLYKDGAAINVERPLTRTAESALKPRVVPGGHVVVYDHGPQKVIIGPDVWTAPVKSFAYTGSGAASSARLTALEVIIGRAHAKCFAEHADFGGQLVLFWYAQEGLFGIAPKSNVFNLSDFPPDFLPQPRRLLSLAVLHTLSGADPCGAGIRIPTSGMQFQGLAGDNYTGEGTDLFTWVRFL